VEDEDEDEKDKGTGTTFLRGGVGLGFESEEAVVIEEVESEASFSCSMTNSQRRSVRLSKSQTPETTSLRKERNNRERKAICEGQTLRLLMKRKGKENSNQ